METHEMEHRGNMRLVGMAAMIAVMVVVIIIVAFVLPGLFQAPTGGGS